MGTYEKARIVKELINTRFVKDVIHTKDNVEVTLGRPNENKCK